MKLRITIVLFLLMLGVQAQTDLVYKDLNISALCRNFVQWQQYQDTQMALYSNFEALDENGISISRLAFMQKLETGTFVCIADPGQPQQYRLFPMPKDANPGVGAILSELGFNGIRQVQMEGQDFPLLDAVDLTGKRITNANLKGNYVVIKCWYIHCPVCVKEFPEVNALVQEYSNLRKDVVFLSLAEDSPEQLKVFLAKKKLDYLVIPNTKDFMNITLGLNAFPTHFLLDKEGKIIKVVGSVDALKWVLQTYLRS
ncbi:TlpA family protein disulfide reductase [Flavobacterium sp. N1719]|uniref:TlpA family protein disulfide reductase n=1 Tax=Flavobacterium sp. N1719 TaxID=2885633 RepID=UPI0022221310|nr:TlpA disulfide reductase family protein [Flavobacterium sp. N1719]